MLERSILEAPPHSIHAIQVDMTVLAGRIVFTRENASQLASPSEAD